MKKQKSNISREEKSLIIKKINDTQIKISEIRSISISYLSLLCFELKIKPEEIIKEIKSNEELEFYIVKAARDAVIFSKIAVSVSPEAFRVAVESLKSMKWQEVEKMRRHLFNEFLDIELKDYETKKSKEEDIEMNRLIFLALTK